jgi:hypothetical protein
VAVFHSAGRIPLFIVMSSNSARYGIMFSPRSYSISPEILSGPIDLFFLIAATIFLMILVSMVDNTSELVYCIC